MHTRKKLVQSVALAMGLMASMAAFANPLDLPPDMAGPPQSILLAQAAPSLQGLIFDASQISPLGDPAWVASLSGPDPGRPALNLGSIDAAAPVTRVGEKDRLPDGTFRRGDATVRNGQVLNNGRVFLIGAERSTLGKAGAILLAPGRAAELGDLRVPFVRVYVTAPTGTALDVDRLVSQRPAIGMFNALFTPVPARRGDTGATAIASVSAPVAPSIVIVHAPASTTAPAMPVAAIASAPVAERSVALLPLPPAQVEERVVIAYVAPVEDKSGNSASIPPASVEERSFYAFVVPVEEKSGLVASIPPAAVEDRSFIAFMPTVEERSALLASIPPATVEDRSFLAFVPSVEERSALLTSIPPASVEDRSFVAFVPTVEERSALMTSIPAAKVEDRSFAAFVAPVEDKAIVARPLVPAPIEERAPVLVARAEVERAPVPVARVAVERAPVPAVQKQVLEPVQLASVQERASAPDIGKPVPGVASESELMAAKKVVVAPAGLVQVALTTPVVVVSAKEGAANQVEREPAPAPVKLAAVQKRLPSIMIDRKGGFFFM
jgi:hypothetical protein